MCLCVWMSECLCPVCYVKVSPDGGVFKKQYDRVELLVENN